MKQDFIIGSYSQNGICKIAFNNGTLLPVNSENSFENNSYLYQNNSTIYSVVEYSNNPLYQNGHVIARNSDLTPTSTSSVEGTSPCFITVDPSRNMLYVANYGDGSIDVFLLNPDGSIHKSIFHKKYSSHSHIHHISFSEDYKFVFILDLGDDTLFSYKIILDENKLELQEAHSYHFPNNSEPRHLVSHKQSFYVITENSCEIYQLSFSEQTGFKKIDCISILPSTIKKEENITGCAIKMSLDYQFLYTTIRGHNSISVIKIHPSLEIIQNISCFGNTPRDIQFDNSQTFLLCANQNSSSISIFNRHKKTGLLSLKDIYPIGSPACII